MGHTKYEGFVERLSPRQLEFISEVLAKHGFGQAKVVIEVVGQAGDNYAADVRRIIAEQDGRELRIIAKIAASNEMMRESMNTRLLFVNEAKMYTEVLPKYRELEIFAKIPKEERLIYATCYGACLEDINEIILLEDLQPKGYAILDKFKPLTDETVRVILKNIAKLHGYCYVLRQRDPETIQAVIETFIDMWDKVLEQQDKLKEMKSAMVKMEDDIINTLNDGHYAKYLKGRISSFADLATEVPKKDNLKSKYSTLQHGDAWTNNILFQLEDDKIISCCMVDYQLAKVASPALDLEYMIFNCTDYETRAKHYHDWIEYYHSQLDDVLSNFGLKANMVYSRDRLDADLKRYAKLSLVNTVFVSSFIVRQNDEAAKLKEMMKENLRDDMEKFTEIMDMSSTGDKTVELFRSKIKGTIDTCVELGYM